MLLKKFETFITFITFALLTFSSPIIIDEEKNSITSIKPTNYPQSITDGLSIIEVKGGMDILSLLTICDDYNVNKDCFSKILSVIGSSTSDQYTFKADGMKGSTFSVPKKEGDGYYVGRNLDLNKDSHNLVLVNYPEEDYSSITTVNLDFIKKVGGEDIDLINNDILMLASIFATLDGLNEKGVHVSINMKQGEVLKNQVNYIKDNAVASYLVRFILDYASTTDQAIDLLRFFEIHNEFDFDVHFMISDTNGKSVVVDYRLDEKGTSKINVTETTIVTNFSFSSGEKSGLGMEQYNIINEKISSTPSMNVEEVKETLEASKRDTQCSIIYDLNNREAIYYVRENYQQGYKVQFDKHIDDSFPPNPEDEKDFKIVDIQINKSMQKVEDTKFRVVEYEGDYHFDEFLAQNGAQTELDIVRFVLGHTDMNIPMNNYGASFGFPTPVDACSAFNVQNESKDGYYFGRNYDWLNGTALAVVTRPKNRYASVSTIDTNLINMFVSGKPMDELLTTSYEETVLDYELPEELLKEIAVYLPFDGMNEKGFSISMNMVNYIVPIEQNDEGKVHLTMTTLIRYLLDNVATVDEAIDVIKNKINMHNSFVHFVIADATGKSAVIEFKADEKEGTKVFVVDSHLATNYFLADDYELKENNYDLIGKDKRYDKILDRLTKKPNQSMKDVRNTLRAGNQYKTAWSIIFDQVHMEATYFIRNDFSVGYRIILMDDDENMDEEETLIDVDDNDLPTEVIDVEDFSTQESSSDEENDDDLTSY